MPDTESVTSCPPPGDARAATAHPEPDLIVGHALAALRLLPTASVDAVICDPPYGLSDLGAATVADTLRRWACGETEYVPRTRGFMGFGWDGFVPPPALWAETLRVLRPGGHLAVFASPRTQHLMGTAMCLAGAQIRDTLAWITASKFPKGTTGERAVRAAGGDESECAAWAGTHSTLRPAVEPILLARAPLDGSLGSNLRRYGTGVLRTSRCATPFADEADRAEATGKNAHGRFGTRGGRNRVLGRFSDAPLTDWTAEARHPASALLTAEAAADLDARTDRASRFFPRIGGGSAAEKDVTDPLGGGDRFFYASRAPVAERPVFLGDDGKRIEHPTVKPLSVTAWLVDLLAAPGQTVLDPFAGSGTTLQAARAAGVDSIGIEADPRFAELIRVRLARSRR